MMSQMFVALVMLDLSWGLSWDCCFIFGCSGCRQIKDEHGFACWQDEPCSSKGRSGWSSTTRTSVPDHVIGVLRSKLAPLCCCPVSAGKVHSSGSMLCLQHMLCFPFCQLSSDESSKCPKALCVNTGCLFHACTRVTANLIGVRKALARAHQKCTELLRAGP